MRHIDPETAKKRDESPNVWMPVGPSLGKLGAFCGVACKDEKHCKNKDLMVVRAVWSEPVSVENSLLTRENTGNFHAMDAVAAGRDPQIAELAPHLLKFPCATQQRISL